MDMGQRIAQLKRTDLFHAFSDRELAALARRVELTALPAGAVLFEEGDLGGEMFILLAGQLSVHRQERLIRELLPPECVGEMALIDAGPRSATVKATTDCQLFRIAAEVFEEFFASQPDSLVAMMATMSQRIRRDTDDIAEACQRANMMVHDMKNLLSSFYLLEMLEKKVPAAAGHRYLEYMRNSRENLFQLMDAFLAMARGRDDSWRRQRHDLAGLLREVVASEGSVHPDLRDKRLELAIEEELPAFPFSREDIRRVLCNLLVNAGQASEPGGRIELRLEKSRDGLARVEVRDFGPGIEPGLAGRIFTPRFTTRRKGCGLGLASCREIVEKQHGGRLGVESAPGEGARFFFLLPLDEPTEQSRS